MDIRPTGIHPYLAQNCQRRITQLLIFGKRNGKRGSNGNRVPRVHTHGINIFNRTHHDKVVFGIPDNLHFHFFPAQHRFFNQHLGYGRSGKPRRHNLPKLLGIMSSPAAQPAKRKRRTNNRGQPHFHQGVLSILHTSAHFGFRRLKPDFGHSILKLLPILGALYNLGLRPYHLNTVFSKHARSLQIHSGIKRSLPTHIRQHRINFFLYDYLLNGRRCNRLNISRICHVGIGHNRCGIGIDKHDSVAFRL